jgi:nuclease-like protein
MTQGPNVMRHGRELEAEERVGALLERELGDVAIVLHDLHVPGSEVRVDHVIVAPTGIWVIDSTLRGELELEVDAVDASASVDAIERHVAVMASAVNGRAKDVSIKAALCFAAEYWGEAPQPFWIDGVLVTHPADLVERVRAAGPLDEDTVGWIAARLSLE